MDHRVEGIIQEVIAVSHWLFYSDWTQYHWDGTFSESYYCLFLSVCQYLLQLYVVHSLT